MSEAKSNVITFQFSERINKGVNVDCNRHAIADVEGNKPFFVDAFIHSSTDCSKIDVIVVSKGGSVSAFRQIALSEGTLDATHDQNVSLDVDLGSVKDISEQSLDVTSEVIKLVI